MTWSLAQANQSQTRKRTKHYISPKYRNTDWHSTASNCQPFFPTDHSQNRKDGRGDWIRTSDPLFPKQMRYQAALLPDRRQRLLYIQLLNTSVKSEYFMAELLNYQKNHVRSNRPAQCPNLWPVHPAIQARQR